jgi:NAD(P)-dependent dehydrogenase (short-subunit alcohol dehydrogenase family)
MTTAPTADLTGRSALITGGGSGIGLACARRLVADGATVTICGRTESRLRDAADEIGANWIVCDVTDEAQVQAAVDAACDAGGGLHIAVANAGSSLAVGPLVMTDLAAWNATVDLNLTGVFLTLKHAAPQIARSGGGAIVAISSIAGVRTHRNLFAYSTTKAAVEMMARTAADELGRFGVRVNAIRPGLVPTDASSVLMTHEATYRDYIDQMPLGRPGEPEEIAAAVRYLVSDEAAWVTGQVLGVDGGHALRSGPSLPFLAERFDEPYRSMMVPDGST